MFKVFHRLGTTVLTAAVLTFAAGAAQAQAQVPVRLKIHLNP